MGVIQTLPGSRAGLGQEYAWYVTMVSSRELEHLSHVLVIDTR